MEKGKYFQIIAQQDGDTVDLLLYGYIGQAPYYSGDTTEPLTDVELATKLDQLSKKYKRINMRINSPGGDRYHGDAIVNAMDRCAQKCDLHTYNDGIAGSMAATLWLRGTTRHMARNGKLMIHATSTYVYGNAQDLRQEADLLDKMDEASIADLSHSTGLSADQVREKFFDYADHWYTYQEVLDMGLIADDDEEYEIEMDQSVGSQSAMQQLAYNGQHSVGLMARIRQLLTGGTDHPSISPQKQEIVDKKTVQEALLSGQLSGNDLADILKEQNYRVEAPATPDEVFQQRLNAALEEKTKGLMEQLTAMNTRLEQLAAMPGAAPTTPQSNADPATPKTDEYRQMAKEHADAAAEGRNPFVGMH